MRSRSPSCRERRQVLGCFFALALVTFGCSSGNDYYYVNEIKGEGDTVLLEFLYTCGVIDVTWDGSFGAEPKFRIDLVVKHDAPGGDCDEDPREVVFDAGPAKQSFRVDHPSPTPLGLRIAPYEEEQGAICLTDLFQADPFKGRRCK
jgi:hypothetical protein